MEIKLFKTSKGIVTNLDFQNYIDKFNLKGKDVLIYSRLLSFGRLLGRNAVENILSILKDTIGDKGTLIIPTYTLNTYKLPRVFNAAESKVMSGILGEFSILDRDFERTIHPVYSNSVYGNNKKYYKTQSETTCFGEGSFFDLFSKTQNGVILMLGLNFNGPTLYHYYDQKFKAKGRFLKSFEVQIQTAEKEYMLNFDSYVKDNDFYYNKMNCLAMFHAVTNKMELVKTAYIGDGITYKITESNFKNLYKTALEVDQEYFLISNKDDWTEYYMKNNFKLFYDSISEEKLKQFKTKWNEYN